MIWWAVGALSAFYLLFRGTAKAPPQADPETMAGLEEDELDDEEETEEEAPIHETHGTRPVTPETLDTRKKAQEPAPAAYNPKENPFRAKPGRRRGGGSLDDVLPDVDGSGNGEYNPMDELEEIEEEEEDEDEEPEEEV